MFIWPRNSDYHKQRNRQRDCTDAVILGSYVKKLECYLYVYLKKIKKPVIKERGFTSFKRKISGKLTDSK